MSLGSELTHLDDLDFHSFGKSIVHSPHTRYSNAETMAWITLIVFTSFDFTVLEAFDRGSQKIGDLYGILQPDIILPSQKPSMGMAFSFYSCCFACSCSYSGIACGSALFPKSQSSCQCQQDGRYPAFLDRLNSGLHACFD
jgi:hypothetical protein